MDKRIKLIVSMIILGLLSVSFVTIDIKDNILTYFGVHKVISQEKIYLHLDKPYYSAGDSIFFKAYLVDAISHSPNVSSNFIYVEMIDQQDSIFMRQKFRRTDSGFTGLLYIPVELKEGQYTLRAYTEWMKNTDKDFFHNRTIEIGNNIMKKAVALTSYAKDADGSQKANVVFVTSEDNSPIAQCKVEYGVFNGNNRRFRFGNQVTSDNGLVIIPLPKPSELGNDSRIEMKITRPSGESKHKVFIPSLTDEYSVSFFPEGGNMIVGSSTTVAFKAQHESGYAQDVTGEVFDSNDNMISSFKSEHDGMGSFVIRPVEGEKYYVKTLSKNGTAKKFNLPLPLNSGYSIGLTTTDSDILYKITTKNVPVDSLTLVAHLRGDVIFAHSISAKTLMGRIPKSMFKEDGIAHFILINEKGAPVSERLSFIKTDNSTNVELKSDKDSYKKRDKIAIAIDLKDENRIPKQGEFSISITDPQQILHDTADEHNILTTLMLTSDIKGYIHNPNYYFSENSVKVNRHLDLVMLTHGWSRFKIENINKLPDTNVKYFREKGQAITGRVLNIVNKGAKEAVVNLASLDGKTIDASNTDDKGEFIFDEVSFKDTTMFIFQARNRRGSDVVQPFIDDEVFPKASSRYVFLKTMGIDSTVMSKYLNLNKEDYYDGGNMPVYDLESVVIYGKKPDDLSSRYSGIGSNILSPEKFNYPGITTAYDAVLRLPGVTELSGKLTVRGGSPMVIIDDVVYDENMQPENSLKDIEVNGVKAVEVIKGASTSFITMGGNATASGVIVVTLKSGFVQKAVASTGYRFFRKLGYTESKEFYSPVYDTPAKLLSGKEDYRSTIFWSPAVVTDETGKAKIEFYASDNIADYDVIIEGIDVNNRPFYKKCKINN